MVSVDVKHHVYLLPRLPPCRPPFTSCLPSSLPCLLPPFLPLLPSFLPLLPAFSPPSLPFLPAFIPRCLLQFPAFFNPLPYFLPSSLPPLTSSLSSYPYFLPYSLCDSLSYFFCGPLRTLIYVQLQWIRPFHLRCNAGLYFAMIWRPLKLTRQQISSHYSLLRPHNISHLCVLVYILLVIHCSVVKNDIYFRQLPVRTQ